MDRCTDGQIDRLTDGRMDGWTDGQMDRWTDGRMDGWTDGRMDGWKSLQELSVPPATVGPTPSTLPSPARSPPASRARPATPASLAAGPETPPLPSMISESYISEGIWRQGIGSFVRNSYVSTLCPVVICPYLCTSDVLARARAQAALPCRGPGSPGLDSGLVLSMFYIGIYNFTNYDFKQPLICW